MFSSLFMMCMRSSRVTIMQNTDTYCTTRELGYNDTCSIYKVLSSLRLIKQLTSNLPEAKLNFFRIFNCSAIRIFGNHLLQTFVFNIIIDLIVYSHPCLPVYDFTITPDHFPRLLKEGEQNRQIEKWSIRNHIRYYWDNKIVTPCKRYKKQSLGRRDVH